MSLEEFNNMGTASATIIPLTTEPVDKSKGKYAFVLKQLENKYKNCIIKDSKDIICLTAKLAFVEVDAEFFERIEKETKEEITKGKEKDILKARLNKIDDDITFAQLRLEIEKRDDIISQLRTEVHTLKEELTQVKERNKKLYQILSHGESKLRFYGTQFLCIRYMKTLINCFFLLVKDKASVLAEVAKLQEIRDELTSEVASLHAQLEQERSKTRTSSVDVKTSKQTVRSIGCLIHFL